MTRYIEFVPDSDADEDTFRLLKLQMRNWGKSQTPHCPGCGTLANQSEWQTCPECFGTGDSDALYRPCALCNGYGGATFAASIIAGIIAAPDAFFHPCAFRLCRVA